MSEATQDLESIIASVHEQMATAQRIASESSGETSELRRSSAKTREAFEMVEAALASHTESLLLWQLKLALMSQGGLFRATDGDYHTVRLQVLDQMLRLNPDDNDELFAKSQCCDGYASEGGLYFMKFSALTDCYYFGDQEEGWPNSVHGKQAAECIRRSVKLHPEQARFTLEEAKAVGLEI